MICSKATPVTQQSGDEVAEVGVEDGSDHDAREGGPERPIGQIEDDEPEQAADGVFVAQGVADSLGLEHLVMQPHVGRHGDADERTDPQPEALESVGSVEIAEFVESVDEDATGEEGGAVLCPWHLLSEPVQQHPCPEKQGYDGDEVVQQMLPSEIKWRPDGRFALGLAHGRSIRWFRRGCMRSYRHPAPQGSRTDRGGLGGPRDTARPLSRRRCDRGTPAGPPESLRCARC